MKKFTKIVILMMVVILSLSMATFAITPGDLTNGTVANGADTATNTAAQIGGTVQNAVQLGGMIAAILILAFYGLQWFIGGAQQKAQLKDKIWAYLIGALLCFAGPAIFVAVAKMFQGAF